MTMPSFNDPQPEDSDVYDEVDLDAMDDDQRLTYDQEYFIFLRTEGKTLRQCAPILERPLSTLGDWNKKFADVIMTCHQENWDLTHRMSRADRLDRITRLLDKAQAFLEKADENRMSHGGMINLFFRLMDMQEKTRYNP